MPDTLSARLGDTANLKLTATNERQNHKHFYFYNYFLYLNHSNKYFSMTQKLIPNNSVQTTFVFNSSPEMVWNELIFYENIKKRKPFLFRLLLPIPIRNEGNVSIVGDETLCLYNGGHLRKRLTEIIENELYKFEITEQTLSIKLGIKLSGGFYKLQRLPNSKTEVTAVTNYSSLMLPRWFWKPIEISVCHWFHKYLLNSINKNIQSQKN